jgi:RNA polymerase sigma-70 factor (ECF subfamily)
MDASVPMPSYTRQFPVSRLSRVVSAVVGACLPGPERAPWRVRLVRRLGSPSGRTLRLHSVDPDLKRSVPDTGATSSAPPALLDAVAKGDARAMKQCIEVHGPLVWGIVRRRVKDHFAAEDLVQEIFTEVWKSSGRHDPAIASEGGFISMIARRRAIDWLRRQQRLPEMECLPEKSEIPAEASVPGLGMDRDTLWAALQRLPDETRRLFVLHFEKGMTHAEIADLTGQPLGSVKTRLRRGLIEARALLQRDSGGGMNLNPDSLS